MADYWLTPVESDDPLVLGAARVRLSGDGTLELFRLRLAERCHARLLPMVKASILPDDSEEEAGMVCGSEDAPRFDEPGPLVFDGSGYGLSHCGRAFVDRLPSARDQAEALDRALYDTGADWSASDRRLLLLMLDWARQGHITMLVKED